METAFGWFGRIIEYFGEFILRWQVVPVTHGGVSFVKGKKVEIIEPGIYWYWPFRTEFTIIPVVRQSIDLPNQTLTTSDSFPITIAAVIVYEITDVVKALTSQWDLDETLQDISCAAVREYTVPRTFEELRIGDDAILKDTIKKRLQRYGVGVRDAWVTDLAITKVITVVGGSAYIGEEEE